MDDFPFKKRANDVWRYEILPHYDPDYEEHSHSITKRVEPKTHLTQDLVGFWETRTKHCLPNSYSYIFGYNPHHILCAKNFHLLHGYMPADISPTVIGPKVEKYLEAIINEQSYFSAYVIRRAVVDIFFNHWEFFTENQFSEEGRIEPKYVISMDITVKDARGVLWHAFQTIEPIFGKGGQYDLLYYCHVSLIKETSMVPFSFRFDHRNAACNDDSNDQVLSMNEIWRANLFYGILDETGFKHSELRIYLYYLSGLDKADIEELHGIKRKNKNRITGDTNKTMRKAFPVLTSNYLYTQAVRRKEQAWKESDKKVNVEKDAKSDFNPRLVASILEAIGLIQKPTPRR